MTHGASTPFHAGVSAPAQAEANPEGSKTLAAVLLAASLSALLVLADQLIETWTDGNLLVGWVALWTVTFAALALLARPLRRLASALALYYAGWAARRRQNQMEEALWEYAHHDQRVMAELEAAYGRQVQ